MPTPSADQIIRAEIELQRLDPLLGPLIQAQAPINRLRGGDYFAALTRSIIGQQVSVAAAAAIYGRFEAATNLNPQKVTTLTIEDLRALGLSRGKAGYIQDLAQHFVKDAAVFDHLDALTDDEVIAELIKVKGIGVWTAQMFLMFTLGRLDVFAPDDGGLQRAVAKLYGLEKVPPKAELIKIAEKWAPYRTIASWHLWESLNNLPVK